jgi:hypothetical protein
VGQLIEEKKQRTENRQKVGRLEEFEFGTNYPNLAKMTYRRVGCAHQMFMA